MSAHATYECPDCEGTGSVDVVGDDAYAPDQPGITDCDRCDGTGVTAIDCPKCGREAVPIHETVFVAAEGRTYCEPCGDSALNRIAASRGQEKW